MRPTNLHCTVHSRIWPTNSNERLFSIEGVVSIAWQPRIRDFTPHLFFFPPERKSVGIVSDRMYNDWIVDVTDAARRDQRVEMQVRNDGEKGDLEDFLYLQCKESVAVVASHCYFSLVD